MDEPNKRPPDLAAQTAYINKLLASARKGDPAVLVELRAFLDSRPEFWQKVGDLGDHAREALITLVVGNDLSAVESMRRKMQQMQEELIGDSTAPIVRLLAEQCVLCWAQLHWAELMLISKDTNGTTHGFDVHKRVNAIQSRYVQALKTLTTVKRLLPPTASTIGPKLRLVSEDPLAS